MKRIDFARHRELEADGYLIIQQHAEADLFIHNYSQKTQFDRAWMPETLMSRGLITDSSGLVIARPFPKFFNFGEMDTPIPNEPFEVYEKLDGSLGVMYFLDNMPHIATRGSFNSEQSVVANEILRSRYGHVSFDPAITYLFEIIYPENRIVVDYGNMRDLLLIGMVETATGKELPLYDFGVPVVKRYAEISDLDSLAKHEVENKEGFVVRFESGLRLKFKFDEYVRLHKVMTRVTPLTIWEILRTGGDLVDLAEGVPDEFFGWARSVEANLKASFAKIEAEAHAEFRQIADRKAAAEYFFTCKHSAILFRMLDGKDYSDYIWRQIRPSENQLVE